MKENSLESSRNSHYIGKKGEDIACKYLEEHGHSVLDRNYRVKGGEIDIVSEKGDKLFFIEVKTTARDDVDSSEMHQSPEENVHFWKMKKFARAVEVYVSSKYQNKEKEWEFWVIAISLDLIAKKAFVKVIPEALPE